MSTRQTTEADTSTSEENLPLFFSDWLKRRRKQLDLTQLELAERACCSVFALRKIEAGERRPSKQLAGMLAKTLEIPAGDHITFVKVARGEQPIEKILIHLGVSKPASSSNQVPGNLPRPLTAFIGREPELTALAQLLHDPQCSLLTITGPGGIGKTRLAIEAVQQSNGVFADGIWFVPLASLNSPTLIVPAIAEAVGFKFQDPTKPQEQLLRYLRAKRALLIMDNAEHLLDGAGLFSEILKECQSIKLLVTSRERLNLMSEWVFEIQGLPVPPDDRVNQFNGYSAVALFIQSARRVQAGYELQADDRQWVFKICQIMEGLPLGIELSAAWVGLLSLEEIAVEIERDLEFLSATMRDIPERHRSLSATLDHSWKLLNPEEKLVLSRLSVFRGHFSRHAAQKICGASLAILSSLKNKSLLIRIDEGEYGLHEIIRQFAGLKLAERPDEFEQVNERHAAYFVQYLADCEAALQDARQVETFDNMAMLIDDLAQGWHYMITHCLPCSPGHTPFPADALHSALFSLSLFYETRCRSLDVIPIFAASVASLKGSRDKFEKTDQAAQFRSILGHIIGYLGLHHCYVVRYDECMEYLEEALTWLNDGESKVFKAQVQVMIASVKDDTGQLLESAKLLEQSREVFRQAGVAWWYTLSTAHLAGNYLSVGKYQESKDLFQEALRLANPGDLRTLVPTQSGYAVLLAAQEKLSEAEQILLETLQLSPRMHNDRQTAYVLLYLGRVVLATHRLELAEEYLQKSINILQEFGEAYDLAIVCVQLGKCYMAQPDSSAARQQFLRAIRLGVSLDRFLLVYFGLVNLARIYVIEGQTDQALLIFLLLKRCPIEHIRVMDDIDRLREDLRAALPERQMDASLKQLNSTISEQNPIDSVLAYIRDNLTQ